MPYALSSTALTLVLGRPFALPMTWQTGDTPPVAINITGFTLAAVLSGPFGSVTATVTTTSASAGQFTVSLTGTQTAPVSLGQLSTLTVSITDTTGAVFDHDIPVNGVAP